MNRQNGFRNNTKRSTTIARAIESFVWLKPSDASGIPSIEKVRSLVASSSTKGVDLIARLVLNPL
ncbi:hypothetical protein BAU15_08435 [Enterococcus sp. JM4C]|nr:hypothetical protein BAU15_08435 [Enterococcus sp. JM4C]